MDPPALTTEDCRRADATQLGRCLVVDFLSDVFDGFQGVIDTLTAVGFAVTFAVLIVFGIATLIRR